jgi:Zn-dependent peptidase ImmA (M78 family)
MNEADLAEIRDWAERFWLLAGLSEPFPRTLESAVSWALPLVLVKLPRLDVESINDYARTNALSLECQTASRSLRGCLIAKAGSGIVFLDGTDPPDELRFTLAHEVAHFLLDHLKPRQDAVRTFGSTIHEVLDGERDPTPNERLNAIFQGVSIERFVHLLERNQESLIARQQILHAEDRADLLAIELLAPLQAIQESLAMKHLAWTDRNAATVLERLLMDEFGLPLQVSENYARFLTARKARPQTFRDWLRGKR